MNFYGGLLATDFKVNLFPSVGDLAIFLVPLVAYTIFIGLSIYIAILVIKALKLYIKNHS